MKAVIYARYSSDNQREESIEGQLRECKEYAERNGILVLQSYIDRALSAKTDNRPEFQRMIRDSAKGLFDTVLVWKLDRFARNRYDSAHYKSQLRKNGVKVISATESIADGPEGIILESMLEGMAEYYSAELAQKVNRGMRENALRRFDFTGQFEDNRIMGLQPYENLTNCTAAPYASYLLTKEQPSGQEIADAVDLIRFSEDQFTCWEAVPNADGIDPINTPCVLEQYKYRVPVDNSACNVADAFINLYQKTGDKIALAKAIALINNITVTQNAVNGFMPTTWDFCTPDNTGQRTYWINCSYSTVCSLFKLDDLLSHNPPEEGKIR